MHSFTHSSPAAPERWLGVIQFDLQHNEDPQYISAGRAMEDDDHMLFLYNFHFIYPFASHNSTGKDRNPLDNLIFCALALSFLRPVFHRTASLAAHSTGCTLRRPIELNREAFTAVRALKGFRMRSAEMETEVGKEVGCSMSMTEGGHGQAQILIPAPGSMHMEPTATPFPTLMPTLVPPAAPAAQSFSYSDLQLVVAPSQTKAVVTNGNSGDGDGDGDGEDEKKRDREHLHKKRSKNWTRVETLKLIKMRTELDPKFARSGRKSELWDEIAEALQKGQFARDAQQCRDKWEKLMAGYKDVREGFKDREDNPYYDELHPLLSGRSLRKEKDREKDVCKKDFDHREPAILNANHEEIEGNLSRFNNLDEEGDEVLDVSCLRKRKRCSKYVSAADIGTVRTLLETVIAQQQKFFKELLESVERNEQAREQIRQEREEKWRAEERAHRNILNNAMIVLTQKLLGERGVPSSAVAAATSDRQCQGPKKRSKNWKRGEVLHLIKLRGEMEGRFANSTRRAVLWEELAETLDTQGIKRDGKQCREKWDKLMAAYKDVIDGKREEGDLPYFSELKAIVGGKPDEGYRFHTEPEEYKENVASIHLMPETVSERPPPSG